jgi:hypothetical protein
MDLSPPAPQPAVRRREARLRLALPAQIQTTHGRYPAALLDLSQSGARIRLAHSFGRSCDAVLYWLQFEAFGRIVWFSPYHAGLEFDEPILAATLLGTRDVIDHATHRQAKRTEIEEARAWYQEAKF